MLKQFILEGSATPLHLLYVFFKSLCDNSYRLKSCIVSKPLEPSIDILVKYLFSGVELDTSSITLRSVSFEFSLGLYSVDKSISDLYRS